MKEFKDLVLYAYKDKGTWITLHASLVNGALELQGQDIGDAAEAFWEDEDYEYWYQLDAGETRKLLCLIKGTEDPERAVQQAFGGPCGSRRFKEVCDTGGIRYRFYSYA